MSDPREVDVMSSSDTDLDVVTVKIGALLARVTELSDSDEISFDFTGECKSGRGRNWSATVTVRVVSQDPRTLS